MSDGSLDFGHFARKDDWGLTREERLEVKIETLRVAVREAHELLATVGGVIKDGEQRMPVGVHGTSGIARYLTASFVQKCADWCARNSIANKSGAP